MESVELRQVAAEVGGRWIGPKDGLGERVTDVCTDTRTLTGKPLFIALRGENFDAHRFVETARRKGAAASIVEASELGKLPSGSAPYIVVDDALEAMERLAVWNRRRLDMRVVGITGSVGKTSTKEFLATVLREKFHVTAAPKSYNNRIGVATTLLSAGPHTEVLVAELGTSQPGELSHLSKLVAPQTVILTEIASAHLEKLVDLDGVVRAKSEVFDGLAPDGIAWIRAGVHGFNRLKERVPRFGTFGWTEDYIGLQRQDYDGAVEHSVITDCVRVGLGDPRSTGGVKAYGYHFTVNDRENLLVPTPGVHNVMNASATFGVARDFGMSWSEIRAALATCRLPPLRLEVVEARGILFVNDSYNANPRSMCAAIDEWSDLCGAAPQPRRWARTRPVQAREATLTSGPVAVLGDMLELGGASQRLHEEIGQRLIETDLRILVTVGKESRWIAGAYRDLGGRAIIEHYATVEEATKFLRTALRTGDYVLIKGSRGIGLERLFKNLHRWVRMSSAESTGGYPGKERRAARARV